jgi:RNA polymerase sigma-70 factor (ECF subfamily)
MNDNGPNFDVVVTPHLADALTLARWLTKNRHDAEDVVQEACLRAFRSIASYQGGSAKGWLLAIVRNTAYSWLKKNRQPAGIFDEAASDADFIHNVPDHGGETPESVLIAKADEARLHAAMRNLAPEFREVLVLREIQGFDYREIAQITSAPVGTVMSRISRARRQLASLVARHDDG